MVLNDLYEDMEKLEVFHAPEEHKKDWRYAVVMDGLSQFGRKPVILDLYENLQQLKDNYQDWAKANKGEDSFRVRAIEIPEGKNYQTVKISEIKTLNDLIQNE